MQTLLRSFPKRSGPYRLATHRLALPVSLDIRTSSSLNTPTHTYTHMPTSHTFTETSLNDT